MRTKRHRWVCLSARGQAALCCREEKGDKPVGIWLIKVTMALITQSGNGHRVTWMGPSGPNPFYKSQTSQHSDIAIRHLNKKYFQFSYYFDHRLLDVFWFFFLWWSRNLNWRGRGYAFTCVCMHGYPCVLSYSDKNRSASVFFKTMGTQVRALVWEDPTCRGATKPMSHNYWACASGAHAPQQERPRQWEARAPRWRVAPARRN